MRPRVVTDPSVGRRIPPMILSSVVFPEPFGPSRPSVLPSPTSSETSRSAQNSSAWTRNRMIRSFSDVGRSR